MSKSISALAFALGMGAAGHALAWGATGHRIIGVLGVQTLPDSLPAFLRAPRQSVASRAHAECEGQGADRLGHGDLNR